mgnify:CR=1 FL=1
MVGGEALDSSEDPGGLRAETKSGMGCLRTFGKTLYSSRSVLRRKVEVREMVKSELRGPLA